MCYVRDAPAIDFDALHGSGPSPPVLGLEVCAVQRR